MPNLLSKIIFPLFFFLYFLSFILLSACGTTSSTISSLTVSPSSATIGISQSQLFTAVAKNSLGQIVSASVTWSTTGGVGTIKSSTGLFTAGSATGEGGVVATYSSLSDSATVTVTEKAWIGGRVLDSKGYKVESMKVYLGSNTSLFDFTDSDGDYSISDIPAGTYEVWTKQTSVYRAASDEVTVASGESETVNFTILYFTDPPDLTPPEYTYD